MAFDNRSEILLGSYCVRSNENATLYEVALILYKSRLILKQSLYKTSVNPKMWGILVTPLKDFKMWGILVTPLKDFKISQFSK